MDEQYAVDSHPETDAPLIMRTTGNPELPHLTVTIERNVTVAAVEMDLGGHLLQVTGSARRHPGDLADARIGVALATSRAFRELTQQLDSYAESLVVENQLRQRELRVARRAHSRLVARKRRRADRKARAQDMTAEEALSTFGPPTGPPSTEALLGTVTSHTEETPDA